jgi:hypothetical protein
MERNSSAKVVLLSYVDFMAENDFGDARFYENLPPDDMPIIIGKFLSRHTKKDLAHACALTDKFSTRYFCSFDNKSCFASLHVKCAQEALDQHEPAVAAHMAIRASRLFGIKNHSGNKQATDARNEITQVLRNIFDKEGNRYGYAIEEALRAIDPSPEDRTAKSDQRITKETGVRDYFPHDR